MELAPGMVTNDGTAGNGAPAKGKPADRPSTNKTSAAPATGPAPATASTGSKGLPRPDLPPGPDGLTGTHQVIYLAATKWGFQRQTIVVVSFSGELPLLQERFPGAAFWSYSAWWRFVLMLGGEQDRTPDANANLLAQLNCLKIAFGGSGASVMMTDDDVRQWMIRVGVDIPKGRNAWGRPWDRPAKLEPDEGVKRGKA